MRAPSALLLALAVTSTGVCADEAADPLVFTVRPSGVDGETLDQKLARRERSFRFICIGCARVDGRVAEAPFRPIDTLNAAGLAAALAEER